MKAAAEHPESAKFGNTKNTPIPKTTTENIRKKLE